MRLADASAPHAAHDRSRAPPSRWSTTTTRTPSPGSCSARCAGRGELEAGGARGGPSTRRSATTSRGHMRRLVLGGLGARDERERASGRGTSSSATSGAPLRRQRSARIATASQQGVWVWRYAPSWASRTTAAASCGTGANAAAPRPDDDGHAGARRRPSARGRPRRRRAHEPVRQPLRPGRRRRRDDHRAGTHVEATPWSTPRTRSIGSVHGPTRTSEAAPSRTSRWPPRGAGCAPRAAGRSQGPSGGGPRPSAARPRRAAGLWARPPPRRPLAQRDDVGWRAGAESPRDRLQRPRARRGPRARDPAPHGASAQRRRGRGRRRERRR